jgi:tetratricopeptide (TPR) repeat protein
VELAAQGNFIAAKQKFEEVLKIDPSRESTKRFLKIIEDVGEQRVKRKTAIHYFKGLDFAEQKHWTKAIAEFSKAIHLNPKLALAYDNRGLAYANRGQWDQAISDFNQVIEIASNFSEAYVRRGFIWEMKGNLNRAVADYNKAIEINPQEARAYFFRGRAYGDRGLYDLALTDFNKAIELNPNSAEAYVRRGIIYAIKDQDAHAVADYNQALEIDPNSVGAYLKRGLFWEMKGNPDRAIADYTKTLEISPRICDAYLSRAIVWLNKGEVDRADDDFARHAICFYVKDDQFQTHLAALETRSKNKDKLSQSPFLVQPILGTAGLKGEWTYEVLGTTAAGCAARMFIHNFQETKNRKGIIDGETPPEHLHLMVRNLFPVFERFCRCIVDKVSSRWNPEEMTQYQTVIEAFSLQVIESGECSIPSLNE